MLQAAVEQIVFIPSAHSYLPALVQLASLVPAPATGPPLRILSLSSLQVPGIFPVAVPILGHPPALWVSD